MRDARAQRILFRARVMEATGSGLLPDKRRAALRIIASVVWADMRERTHDYHAYLTKRGVPDTDPNEYDDQARRLSWFLACEYYNMGCAESGRLTLDEMAALADDVLDQPFFALTPMLQALASALQAEG